MDKEISKLLDNIAIYFHNQKESKLVQETLFNCGFEWKNKGQTFTKLSDWMNCMDVTSYKREFGGKQARYIGATTDTWYSANGYKFINCQEFLDLVEGFDD